MFSLNEDCIYNVFLNLNNIVDLSNCSKVNKQLNKCYKAEPLWKHHFNNNFEQSNCIKKETAFETYKINKQISKLIDFYGYKEYKTIPTLYNSCELVFPNLFGQIPKEIGVLINLKKLEFPDNMLKKIPKEICNLTNLYVSNAVSFLIQLLCSKLLLK